MKNAKKVTSEASLRSPEASPDVECTWSRLPKPGEVEPRSGLNRHAINKLILGEHPLVISKALKSRPDAKRSIRLVKITGKGSLLEFLEFAECVQRMNK